MRRDYAVARIDDWISGRALSQPFAVAMDRTSRAKRRFRLRRAESDRATIS
jgi:hypothetical protein